MSMFRRSSTALLAVVLAVSTANAQTIPPLSTSQGGTGTATSANTSGGIPYLNGSFTINDCLKWTSSGIADAGSACGAGGGAVSSVSNSDGTLTISPTTGAVVAGLALGHANTWSALQTFATGGLAINGGAATAGVATVSSAGVISSEALVSVAQGGNGTGSPALTAGTNITLSGSWPNYTINATGGGSGTVNSGTSGQVAYYGSTGTAVSGEALSALLDSSIGSTQGGVLYRGASTWTLLSPGTSGYFLETQGASANPTWAPATGGGGTPGGTSGQTQYNNGGSFGGYTLGGDCTLVASTGVITCLKTNGTAFGSLATLAPGTGVATALGNATNASGGVVTYSGALGTPTSGTLTNATGLPISTGVSGLGTGVATALGTAANGSGGAALVNGSPTSGNCLKWSSSGVQDAGSACGGGGGGPTTLISTQTASSATSLSWTGLTTYNIYRIVCTQMTATSGTYSITFGTGSGPTYLTSGYNVQELIATSSTVIGSTSGSGYLGSSSVTSIDINLHNMAASPTYNPDYISSSGASVPAEYLTYGNNSSPGAAITAIKIAISGTSFSGVCSLYGTTQ